MHEIGVLYKMVEQAEQAAQANGFDRILAINVEVGELSGILPVFLEKYYPVVIENRRIFRDSVLRCKMIPAKGLCRDCSAMYDVAARQGVCPKCGSRRKKILGGTDFILKSIEMEETQMSGAASQAARRC